MDSVGEPFMLKTLEEDTENSMPQPQNLKCYSDHNNLSSSGEQVIQIEEIGEYQNPEEALREALQNGDGLAVIPPLPPLPLNILHFFQSESPAIFGPVEPLPNALDLSLLEFDVDATFEDDFEVESPIDEEEAIELENELFELISNESIHDSNEERLSSGHEFSRHNEERHESSDHQEGNCCENSHRTIVDAFFDKPHPIAYAIRGAHLHFGGMRNATENLFPLGIKKLEKDSGHLIEKFSKFCVSSAKVPKFTLPSLNFKNQMRNPIEEMKNEVISNYMKLNEKCFKIVNLQNSETKLADKSEDKLNKSVKPCDSLDINNINLDFSDNSSKENCDSTKHEEYKAPIDYDKFSEIYSAKFNESKEFSNVSHNANEKFESNDIKYMSYSNVASSERKLCKTSSLAVNLECSRSSIETSSSTENSRSTDSHKVLLKSQLKEEEISEEWSVCSSKTSDEWLHFEEKQKSLVLAESKLEKDGRLRKIKSRLKLSLFSRRLRYFWSLIFK